MNIFAKLYFFNNFLIFPSLTPKVLPPKSCIITFDKQYYKLKGVTFTYHSVYGYNNSFTKWLINDLIILDFYVAIGQHQAQRKTHPKAKSITPFRESYETYSLFHEILIKNSSGIGYTHPKVSMPYTPTSWFFTYLQPVPAK